ncbi:MAG: hypothetical protein IFJ97_02800, partial [Acidobacteria bacterium]|nr:hypothetical protein [Candidatus Sulfomarinibacter kjeldsenii]
MKRFIPYIALLALVAMVGCSADSPRAKPAPTVVPQAWAITNLIVIPSNPFVGNQIDVGVAVTSDGSPAPDDTAVTFEVTPPTGVSADTYGFAGMLGQTTASGLTEGGTTVVGFVANIAGNYQLRARVSGVSDTVSASYRESANSGALQITDINPRRGSYAGGDQIVITGIGIENPVDVYFDLDGFAYQAIIVGTTPSEPVTAVGTITVITPAFTG